MLSDIGTIFPQSNRLLRIPFIIVGVDEAIASQGNNFNREKVNIAWRQALSLWHCAAKVDFQPVATGETPRLRVTFVHNGNRTLNIGTTSGHIDRNPNGPPSVAGIEISLDNDWFIDKYLEPRLHPTGVVFDLIGVTTHEVGHALGIDHPPIGPNGEAEAGLMSPSQAEGVVRQLMPYDIREVQRLHETLQFGAPVNADLVATGQLIDASPGVTLQPAGSGLVVAGPMQTRTFVDVLVPAKHHLVNSLRLKFTTVTKNVFINRVAVFESIIPYQEFAVSARGSGAQGLSSDPWDLRFGFLSRRVMQHDMLVRMEIFFTSKGGSSEVEFGVVQIHEIAVETLPQEIVVDPGWEQ